MGASMAQIVVLDPNDSIFDLDIKTSIFVSDLLPFWSAKKLKILEIGNATIRSSRPGCEGKDRNAQKKVDLLPVKFLSFRNCILASTVPDEILAIRKTLAAEIRGVDRDINLGIDDFLGNPGLPRTRTVPLLDALAPFVTNLTFQAQNAPLGASYDFEVDEGFDEEHILAKCSHPLPNLSQFVVLSTLTIDLGNLCFEYWADWSFVPTSENPLITSRDSQGRLHLWPLDCLNSLPTSLQELTIEIRTWLIDHGRAAWRIASWLWQEGDESAGCVYPNFPPGLRSLQLDALQCCRAGELCREQLGLQFYRSWQWYQTIPDEPKPRSENFAPRDRIIVFDSARHDAGSDQEDEKQRLDDKGEDSEVQECSVNEHRPDWYQDEEYENTLILLAAKAGINLVLANRTVPMTKGRVFGDPRECHRSKGPDGMSGRYPWW